MSLDERGLRVLSVSSSVALFLCSSEQLLRWKSGHLQNLKLWVPDRLPTWEEQHQAEHGTTSLPNTHLLRTRTLAAATVRICY